MTESHEGDNKPVFERFYHPSPPEPVGNKSKHRILHSHWLLNRSNRGKNNRRTLIGTAERWLRPLNKGSRLKGVLFTVFPMILTIVSGLQ